MEKSYQEAAKGLRDLIRRIGNAENRFQADGELCNFQDIDYAEVIDKGEEILRGQTALAESEKAQRLEHYTQQLHQVIAGTFSPEQIREMNLE